jgi:alpha-1,6-mannosyltransferase
VRVVDVTSFFSDTCGGIKTYYRAKAEVLPARGLECHFVVPGATRADEPFGGGTLHRLPGPRLGRSPYRAFGGLAALRELLGDLRPDVVEVGTHYFLPQLVEQALRGMARAPRLVGFYHADYPETYVAPALRRAPECLARGAVSLAWAFCRRQHMRYHATLAASRFVARTLGAQGIPRVHWIGLGVDTRVFHPGAGTRAGGEAPLVVYAGRLSADKGFPLVLAAWDTIHRATSARLVVVGDGPLGPAVAAFAASRAHVGWRGYVDRAADVAALLASADAVLAPGAHESFSLATAEALACGTPVVGADRGGNAELVDVSGGGITFRTGRAETLAAGVVGLLGLPAATRHELGVAGRAHIERALTWDHVATRLCQVYES